MMPIGAHYLVKTVVHEKPVRCRVVRSSCRDVQVVIVTPIFVGTGKWSLPQLLPRWEAPTAVTGNVARVMQTSPLWV